VTRALVLLLLVAVCACAHGVDPRLPASDLHVHVVPTHGLARIPTGVLWVSVFVGGIAGVAVSCTRVSYSVDGYLLGKVEPDCAPGTEDHDGGALPTAADPARLRGARRGGPRGRAGHRPLYHRQVVVVR
jgi:hypothetical protein